MTNSIKRLDEIARDLAYDISLGVDGLLEAEDVAHWLSPFAPLTSSEVKVLKERIAYHYPDFDSVHDRSEAIKSEDSGIVDEYLSMVEVRDSDTPIREEFAHLNDVQERGKWFKLREGVLFRCTEATREFLVMPTKHYAKAYAFFECMSMSPEEALAEVRRVEMRPPEHYTESVEIPTLEAALQTVMDLGKCDIDYGYHLDEDLSPYYEDSVTVRLSYSYDGDAHTFCLTKHAVGEEPKTYKLEDLSEDELNRLISVVKSVEYADFRTKYKNSTFEFEKPIPVSYESRESGCSMTKEMLATHIVLPYDSYRKPQVIGNDYSTKYWGGEPRKAVANVEDLSEKSIERIQRATEEAYKKLLNDSKKMQQGVMNIPKHHPSNDIKL